MSFILSNTDAVRVCFYVAKITYSIIILALCNKYGPTIIFEVVAKSHFQYVSVAGCALSIFKMVNLKVDRFHCNLIFNLVYFFL